MDTQQCFLNVSTLPNKQRWRYTVVELLDHHRHRLEYFNLGGGDPAEWLRRVLAGWLVVRKDASGQVVSAATFKTLAEREGLLIERWWCARIGCAPESALEFAARHQSLAHEAAVAVAMNQRPATLAGDLERRWRMLGKAPAATPVFHIFSWLLSALRAEKPGSWCLQPIMSGMPAASSPQRREAEGWFQVLDKTEQYLQKRAQIQRYRADPDAAEYLTGGVDPSSAAKIALLEVAACGRADPLLALCPAEIPSLMEFALQHAVYVYEDMRDQGEDQKAVAFGLDPENLRPACDVLDLGLAQDVADRRRRARTLVRFILAHATGREREAAIRYGKQDETLEEIARAMGISKQWVSRLLRKAGNMIPDKEEGSLLAHGDYEVVQDAWQEGDWVELMQDNSPLGRKKPHLRG